jgi:hypothetical protein
VSRRIWRSSRRYKSASGGAPVRRAGRRNPAGARGAARRRGRYRDGSRRIRCIAWSNIGRRRGRGSRASLRDRRRIAGNSTSPAGKPAPGRARIAARGRPFSSRSQRAPAFGRRRRQADFDRRKRHAIDDGRLEVDSLNPRVPSRSPRFERLNVKAVMDHGKFPKLPEANGTRHRNIKCEPVHIWRYFRGDRAGTGGVSRGRSYDGPQRPQRRRSPAFRCAQPALRWPLRRAAGSAAARMIQRRNAAKSRGSVRKPR